MKHPFSYDGERKRQRKNRQVFTTLATKPLSSPPRRVWCCFLHLSAKPYRSVAVVEGIGIIRMHGKDIILQENLELIFLHPNDSTSFIGPDAPVFDQVPK